MRIRPRNGVNLRLKAYDLAERDQWAFMQNVDMGHDEQFEQIKGSVKYHGATLGTNSPTAIMPHYNKDSAEVLTACDDKILKRAAGKNEFETLVSGLTPNKIRFDVQINYNKYIAHPDDGLLEYDGISKIRKVNDILLKDIIAAKETNRCFAITKDGEIVWTDDLATIQGVPLEWNSLNVATIFPTKGDEPEKLWILNGRLIVLMGSSIWVYYINGSATSWRPEKAPSVVGLAAPRTVRQVGEELWFLGFSPDTGIGLFAFNGRTCRLLSYDIEPYLKRINPEKISNACAEYVDHIYKLSFALDQDAENSTTFHFDAININKETESPNIYGPHPYGFECSAALDTKRFKGEHIFGRKHSDGGRIFRVADYNTFYSDELSDNGNLIYPILLSAIYEDETIGKTIYDGNWIKRYEKIFLEKIPTGTHSALIEILKGFENEVFEDFEVFLEGNNDSIEALDLDSDPVDFESLNDDPHLADFQADAIQLKIHNYSLKKKLAFRALNYDARPIRRKKRAQIVGI